MDEARKTLNEAKKTDTKRMQEEMQKMRAELEKQKMKMQLDMKKMNEEIRLNKLDMEKELRNAKEQVENSKAEMMNYKTMINEMEKDGLLKTSEDYTIEFKSGALYINGKQQPESVSAKYKKYLNKPDLVIKNRNGNININD